MPPTPPRARLAGERPARRSVLERERAKTVRRQRLLTLGLFALVIVGIVLSFALSSGGHATRRTGGGQSAALHGTKPAPASSPRTPPTKFAVGLRVLRLIDNSRSVGLPNGATRPRTLLTFLRYPALGTPSATDVKDAPAARADGPFPLIVFGHGFGVTPSVYARMLQSWARAGYVVAAPVFPLENANAPGGPNEADLVNQPADMRFVISRMLSTAAAGSGPLAGLIDSAHIAVTGHSDGGDTALAVAYNPTYRDRRVRAAIILSGAEIPGVSGFTFPPGSPPLLATQGTADPINPPNLTTVFFGAASRPKYELSLLGAEHLPPYSSQQPQLAIVERATIAFLDGYLKGKPGAPRRLVSLGNVPGTVSLIADP